MSNTRVRFAKTAERDLRGIRNYPRSTWGEAQWVKTKARLDRAFDHLSLFPDSGRIDSIDGEAARALLRGAFVIFYDHDTLGVLVLRVMSQRQVLARDHHETWVEEDDSSSD